MMAADDADRALLGAGLDALAYWQMREEDVDPDTERRDGWTLYGPADAPRYAPLVELAERMGLPDVQVAPYERIEP